MDYSRYFAGVALGVLAGGCLTALGMKKRGAALKTVLWTVLGAVLLGAAGARFYYIFNRHILGGVWEEYGLLSDQPYEYAVCGAALGMMAGALLAALVCRVSPAGLLDALTPGALLALAAARMAELFADFGWGGLIEDPRWQFFPVAVRDEFGDWYAALNLAEAAAALVILLLAVRRSSRLPGARFALALLGWSMSQILFESLREETLRWGFVRVQQVQCAVFGAGVLLWAELVRGKGRPGWALCAAGYAAGVAALVAIEFILDRLPWPRWADYLAMAVILAAMDLLVRRRVRLAEAAARE